MFICIQERIRYNNERYKSVYRENVERHDDMLDLKPTLPSAINRIHVDGISILVSPITYQDAQSGERKSP